MASRIHGLQDHCGSGLARDGIAAQYLTDRVACIAGKPAPTGYAWPAEFTACRIIVGAGLLAMISLRCTCQTVLSASQASQLPQVMQGQQNSRLAGSLWERACPRWHRRAIPDRPCCLHRRQACSHKLCKASRIHGLQDHCGSGLARDGIAAQYLTDRVASIAGKPAPTDYARPAEFTACRTIVGAGLLAMISLRCTCQTVLSASQASQLPQVMHGQQNSRLAGSLWERACSR